MSSGYPTEVIQEGKAKLIIPKLDEESGEPLQHLRSEAPVFYNPVMKTNRDTAVLMLRAYQGKTHHPITVCEPMTGSGVRGIRLLLEAHEIETLTLGDLNPSALRLARENAYLNGLSERLNLRELDASLLLSLHSYPFGRFDYVDIDPYGSPTTFIDAAIMATKNHGVIALTATDMAPLCGVNKLACLRKYGGWPLNGDFCHETALRLMAGAMIRHAAVYEYAATPLFSYYADHYIRGYYRIDRGAKRADSLLEQMGHIRYCPVCQHSETSKNNSEKNCVCGEPMKIGGPMWLGELSDPEYTDAMMVDLDNLLYLNGAKAEAIIKLVHGEYGFPVGFFIIDSICRSVGIKSVATEDALNAISGAGFRVTRVHYDPRGLKTDATAAELVDVFKKWLAV
ncbi:MAG: tRNA (guanine(10)-N(2))-dimethyltransferase [Candidatus Bathyarchaeota archaeon]